MAVNFVKVLMTKFETQTLKSLHDHKPILRLQFTDDIFFVREESQNNLTACISVTIKLKSMTLKLTQNLCLIFQKAGHKT